MYSDAEDDDAFYCDKREVLSDPGLDAVDMDERVLTVAEDERTPAMDYYACFDDEKSDFRYCFADVCVPATTSMTSTTSDAAQSDNPHHDDDDDNRKRRYLGDVLDAADEALFPPRPSDGTTWQPALVHDGRPLQHSPASHFFMQHVASQALVLLPVSALVNRQEMRERHGDLVVTTTHLDNKDNNNNNHNNNNNNNDNNATSSSVDFAIGYLGGVATGWAMPRTTDADVLATLKAHYPGWRTATADDLPMFMRDFVPRDGPDARVRSHPLQRHLTWRMRSRELLEEAVTAAGGWPHVRLVALDVVAASVAGERAVPLPLEMAFAGMAPTTTAMTRDDDNNNNNDNNNDNNNNDDDDDVWHFFVHPGAIRDKEKAYVGALRKHGVPVDKVTFLRDDYDALARHLARAYLRDTHTIFVCNSLASYKPATMQPQALRWLFAAAAATATTATTTAAADTNNGEACKCDDDGNGDDATRLHIPQLSEVRCFDVATVLDALYGASQQQQQQQHDEQDGMNACADNTDDVTVADDDDDGGGTSRTPSEKQRSDEDERVCAGECDGACWYHVRIEALWGAYDTLHCARRTAVRLRRRLRTAWTRAVGATTTAAAAATAAEVAMQQAHLSPSHEA